LLLIFLGVERNVKKSVPLGSLKFGVCLQEKLPLSTYNAVASCYTCVTLWFTSNFSRQFGNLKSFPGLGNKKKIKRNLGILSKKIKKINPVASSVVLHLTFDPS